jgi:hypothetical protein
MVHNFNGRWSMCLVRVLFAIQIAVLAKTILTQVRESDLENLYLEVLIDVSISWMGHSE